MAYQTTIVPKPVGSPGTSVKSVPVPLPGMAFGGPGIVPTILNSNTKLKD